MESDLKALAERALNEARRELLNEKSLAPYFWVRLPEGKMQKLAFPEMAQGLNSGEFKDRLFGLMRAMVQAFRLTAVVFVDNRTSRRTTEARKLDSRSLLDLRREHESVKRGLAERSEAILITVQTPEGVLVLQQLYDRCLLDGGILFRERQTQELRLDQFQGRQKMFGDCRSENLR